jgi:tyrosinase
MITAMYEKALIEECGLPFGQPYWDWSLDVSTTNESSTAVYSSPVFDPVTGFGGNGPYLEASAAVNVFNRKSQFSPSILPDADLAKSLADSSAAVSRMAHSRPISLVLTILLRIV